MDGFVYGIQLVATMKRLALLASLLLAGCATTPGGAPNPIIAQVQAIAIQACAFEPTVKTILSILALGNPLLGTASSIADAICAAVTPKTASALKRNPPQVGGVVIHGKFIR